MIVNDNDKILNTSKLLNGYFPSNHLCRVSEAKKMLVHHIFSFLSLISLFNEDFFDLDNIPEVASLKNTLYFLGRRLEENIFPMLLFPFSFLFVSFLLINT